MAQKYVTGLVLVAVVLGGGLSACSDGPAATAVSQPAALAGPGRVSVAEFAAVIAKPGVQIIDVRTPSEFGEGHIQGAVNIPVQQADFAQRVSQLDRDGTYAVYCRSGNRSKGAVEQMRSAGIGAIYELVEGTNGWTAEGRPLTR